MREKLKFNDLVRMLLVYIFDNRKGETEAIYIKNKTLFDESMNKGVIGLLSDWRNRYGLFTLKTINKQYTMTQIQWLLNEIKQARIQFLYQLDERTLIIPKTKACAYGRVKPLDKRVNWEKIQRFVDSRNKDGLMNYLVK